jgi:ParB family chromosome partitioning protein
VEVIEISLDRLREAPWNANSMDPDMLARLKQSIARYGFLENLVVRPLDEDAFEVLCGNQRFKALGEAGYSSAPCAVVDLDDAHARLLADALNHIKGEDDLGVRAEMMRTVLATVSEEDVRALLPETVESLRSLASLGTLSLATSLKKWQQGRESRLHHLGFQLTESQLQVVNEAIAGLMSRASRAQGDSPNVRGTALYLLCKDYIERKERKK